MLQYYKQLCTCQIKYGSKGDEIAKKMCPSPINLLYIYIKRAISNTAMPALNRAYTPYRERTAPAKGHLLPKSRTSHQPIRSQRAILPLANYLSRTSHISSGAILRSRSKEQHPQMSPTLLPRTAPVVLEHITSFVNMPEDWVSDRAVSTR